jgi:prevent-host-death family protein
MDVGVHELELHLAEYLARAAAGEVIRVTDRGRPCAVLGPVPGTARLDEGVRQGWITPGSGEAIALVERQRGTGSIQQVLTDDRE